jgi:hypothetical protein
MSDRRSIVPLQDRSAAAVGSLCDRTPQDMNEQERMSRLTRTIEGEIVPRLLISSSVSYRSGALIDNAAELSRLLTALTRLETALREVTATPAEDPGLM